MSAIHDFYNQINRRYQASFVTACHSDDVVITDDDSDIKIVISAVLVCDCPRIPDDHKFRFHVRTLVKSEQQSTSAPWATNVESWSELNFEVAPENALKALLSVFP